MGCVEAFYLLLRACVISRASLAAENLALRQQLSVLEHSVKRPKLRQRDRRFWVWLSRLWPAWRSVLRIVQPDTVIKWHQQGFKLYWRWKSKPKTAGRPPIDKEVRDLIRRMARDNPLWGAPHILSELRLLGYEVAQATVAKYMPKIRKPPSQTWRTFLDNHVRDIVAIDFFTVPTLTFRVLYGFLVLRHDQRVVVHFHTTEHPTAQWAAQQIVEAFPFDEAPRISPARSRRYLRGVCQTAGAEHGHGRGCDRAALAVAKSIRGTHDWHPTARAPRSGDRAQRSPSVSTRDLVLELLSHGASPPIVGSQCTDATGYPRAKRRQSGCHA